MATYVDLNSPGTPLSLSRASLFQGKDTENEKYAAFDETNIANSLFLILSSRISGLTLNAPLLGSGR